MIPELEAIRHILRSDWDPIGVGNGSGDEYDGYAMHLFTILHQNAAEREVQAYLDWAETEHMGLPRRSGITAEIAARIVQANQHNE